jgi:hypothetical protein
LYTGPSFSISLCLLLTCFPFKRMVSCYRVQHHQTFWKSGVTLKNSRGLRDPGYSGDSTRL